MRFLLQMLQRAHTRGSSLTWGSTCTEAVYTVKCKVKKVKLVSQRQMWILDLNGRYQILLHKGCRNVDAIRFGAPVFLYFLVELTAFPSLFISCECMIFLITNMMSIYKIY